MDFKKIYPRRSKAMSFNIDWSLLGNQESIHLIQFINTQFEKAEKPDFLGSLKIESLDFGNIPPEISIVNMTDPWPEFYQDEDDEDDEEFDRNESFSGTVQCSDSISMIHQRNTNNIHEHSHDIKTSIVTTPQIEIQMKSDLDCQLEFDFNYNGNAQMTFSIELIIHHPTPCFLTLPLRMTVTNLELSARALIVYLNLNQSLQICFTKESLPILQNINIETEIGDRDRQVLKNVGKIEKFICEQLRMILVEWFVFPNCYFVDLSSEDSSE